MEALTSQLGGLNLCGETSYVTIIYLLGKSGNYASYFSCFTETFCVARCASTPETFEVGHLYGKLYCKGSGEDARFLELGDVLKRAYVSRRDFSLAHSYDSVLGALLLGCRVRDYEQSCATVLQRSPLIITMPNRPGFITELKFRTETGVHLEVSVDEVNRDNDKSLKLFCTPRTALPHSIRQKSRLKCCVENERIPVVTQALHSFYTYKRPIENWDILNRIYGKRGAFSYEQVDRAHIKIDKADGGAVLLNAAQSEAVRRYLSDDCPAFAVESPPGSGKTVTAAAMAVSYEGPGLQLFLSTANVPVFNIALALAAIDYGDRKIVHLVSADREASQKEQERSPFSIIDADEDDPNQALFRMIGVLLPDASKKRQRALKQLMRRTHANAIAASGEYNIILATVDMILGKLLKPKKETEKKPCPIQAQLETRVRRIVVDEASQLTEAALNALILCFPQAQIVLIGDSKQLPPFKYTSGDVVSELAACSALEVLTRKKNVPVVSLLFVYRAPPSMIRHYSDAFYGGKLVSCKPKPTRPAKPLFWTMKGISAERAGTSLINEGEIGILEGLLKWIQQEGNEPSSVMVIAYYEAQKRLAESRLPSGYEVLTVDSAQGREKDIVIVLTTGDSKTISPFLTCPLRCNVAVSRHKKELFVLGDEALLTKQPWDKVLDEEYFFHFNLKLDRSK